MSDTAREPSRKPVHLAVYDTYADWETGHTTAHLTRRGHRVRTVAFAAEEPVTTMGGVRIRPDLALAGLRPEDSSLLILTGAALWDTGDTLAPFAAKAREFLAAGVPVAAICGATAGLAREGLLDGQPAHERRRPVPGGAARIRGRPRLRRDGRGHGRRPHHGGADGAGGVRPRGVRPAGRVRAGRPGRLVPPLPRLGRHRVPGAGGRDGL